MEGHFQFRQITLSKAFDISRKETFKDKQEPGTYIPLIANRHQTPVSLKISPQSIMFDNYSSSFPTVVLKKK